MPPRDLPPFDSSAMDGYAVRAADTPGSLRVVGHSAAGRPEQRAVGPGEAVVISTGAVVPAGADAVVPVERTSGSVEVERVGQGDNVRPRGGDARAGDVVVTAGSRLRPAAGRRRSPQPAWRWCAAGGDRGWQCSRPAASCGRPASGSRPGEIYESNSIMIAAQLAGAGADANVLPAVADDDAATRDALARRARGTTCSSPPAACRLDRTTSCARR